MEPDPTNGQRFALSWGKYAGWFSGLCCGIAIVVLALAAVYLAFKY